jgi:hypothetical protein
MYEQMKPLWKALAPVSLVALFMASCFDPPVYSLVPVIELQDLYFLDVEDPSQFDTLVIKLKFKDGDGNLGIGSNEISEPFNDKYFFDLSGKPIAAPLLTDVLMTYDTRRNAPYDTLPGFIKPYNCINWLIDSVQNKLDTFYFQLNPNHYNIFVDFLEKNADGSFTEFDWRTEFTYPNCGITFDGRFPILSDLNHKTPLDGTIKYGMVSTGFLVLFSIKTLKLRITIQDRAFNKSNVVETKEFTLQSIKSGG